MYVYKYIYKYIYINIYIIYIYNADQSCNVHCDSISFEKGGNKYFAFVSEKTRANNCICSFHRAIHLVISILTLRTSLCEYGLQERVSYYFYVVFYTFCHLITLSSAIKGIL